MNTSVPAQRDWESMESFSVVVLYEDTVTHNRVRDLCDQLLDQFWGQLEFDVNWWSFSSLQDAEVAQRAAQVAVRANLILISTHATQTLPPHVQDWCESWAAARDGAHGALAALVGMPQEIGAEPIITYLQRLAGLAQLTFLPNVGDAGQELESASASRQLQVTHDLNRLLDPRRPPSHWGINE